MSCAWARSSFNFEAAHIVVGARSVKEVLQGVSEQVKAQFASLAQKGHPEVRDPATCRDPLRRPASEHSGHTPRQYSENQKVLEDDA